jgi:hypothetical protein
MRYRRVVIKLSGGALAGREPIGLDAGALEHVADEILAVVDQGVQATLVVGGGNFFRGTLAEHWGIERAEADSVGILGTVMNGPRTPSRTADRLGLGRSIFWRSSSQPTACGSWGVRLGRSPTSSCGTDFPGSLVGWQTWAK